MADIMRLIDEFPELDAKLLNSAAGYLANDFFCCPLTPNDEGESATLTRAFLRRAFSISGMNKEALLRKICSQASSVLGADLEGWASRGCPEQEILAGVPLNFGASLNHEIDQTLLSKIVMDVANHLFAQGDITDGSATRRALQLVEEAFGVEGIDPNALIDNLYKNLQTLQRPGPQDCPK